MPEYTIGGSEIGAIAGLNPFKTPLQVFLTATGRIVDTRNADAKRLGQLFENPIAEYYYERHPELKSMLPQVHTLFHQHHKWWRGTPDRELISDCRYGLEIKTANFRQMHRWGESGTDEIPDEYRAQVAWYQGLTGFDRWDVAVLLGGADYREYTFQRDLALEEALRECGERFLRDHLIPDRAPPIDGSTAASEWLARRFAKPETEPLKSTEATDALALQYRAAKARLESAEEDEAELKNRLKELIGSARGLVGDWGKITWGSRRISPRTDWEAVAQELHPSPELVVKHTRPAGSSRFFKATFKED